MVYEKKKETGGKKLEFKNFCATDTGEPEVINFTINNRRNIDCRSTSRHIITIDGMVVMFESREQNSVSRSSTKSEPLTASDSMIDYKYT
jgi:hypothetical protein